MLRTGGTANAIGCVVKAPSTLGTFLRSFRWGHVRQLDRVSRELLAQAWAAGSGPGDGPLTIDLDSTLCETFGLAKEGAQRHNYAGQRGYHPLLAVAAGTGDVLMARLRKGSANTGAGRGSLPARDRGAGTLRRSRRTTHRAGRQRVLHPRHGRHLPKAGCPLLHHRPPAPPTAQHHRGPYPRRNGRPFLTGWRAPPTVAETAYVPFGSKPDAAPVRLIVRRVKPTPGSQLALFTSYSYHGCITDRDGDTLDLEADHRRHAEIENAIRDLKYGVGLNHLPSGRFPANGAWLAVQVMAHNLARWTTRIGLGEPAATTKTLRRRLFSLAGRLTPQGTPPHPSSSPGLALAKPVQLRSGPIARPATPLLTTPTASDCPPDYPTPWPTPARLAPRVSCCNLTADLARRRRCGPSTIPFASLTHSAPVPTRRDQRPAGPPSHLSYLV